MIARVKMGVMQTNIGLLYWSLKCVNFHIFWFVVCLHKYRVLVSCISLRAVVLCSSIGGRSSATAVNNFEQTTLIFNELKKINCSIS